MELKIVAGLDHLAPEEKGEVTGRMFAELAVELRLRGLPVEVWCKFMNHRVASLSKQFASQKEVDTWAAALLASYQDAIDHDLDNLQMMATAKI